MRLSGHDAFSLGMKPLGFTNVFGFWTSGAFFNIKGYFIPFAEGFITIHVD